MKSLALLSVLMVCGLLSSLTGFKQDVQPVAGPTTFTMAVGEDGEAAVDPKAGDILQWSSPAPGNLPFKLVFLGYDPCSESNGEQEANGHQHVYLGSKGHPVICHITAAGYYLYDIQTTPPASQKGLGQTHRLSHVGTCKGC